MNFAWLLPVLVVASAHAADFSAADDALRIASREGRLKDMARLISQGADVNSSSDYGETGLMYAARFNRVMAARLLIRHGAHVNERDFQGRTVLSYAAVNCSQHIVESLIKARVDVNAKDFEGRTPLMIAAENGCRNTVMELLQVPGIAIDARDDSSRTALDYAEPEAQAEVGGPFTDIVSLIRAKMGLAPVPALAPIPKLP